MERAQMEKGLFFWDKSDPFLREDKEKDGLLESS